jgi:alkyl sulfatase BDS1-like metallo-beta-lactamase superfamily hydrolase
MAGAGLADIPASAHTKAANAAVYEQLDFTDRQSFDDVSRGFIGAIEPPIIYDAEGNVVWDLQSYDFLAGEAPDTAHPSLWRQAQLNAVHGLYEITDGIYQLRGYDVSNMVVVRGETGWIVIDPMLTEDTARAGLDLVFRELGEAPVTAVIYTHSHADHFGGAQGVVDAERYANGEIEVIAPAGFVEHAISENVIAGNAMGRRASYMYGNVVARGPAGQIGAGLGKTTSTGIASVVEPTNYISETGTVLVVDGVEMEFVMANGSEAPVEFMFYFPQKRALCTAEVTSQTMHNIYSLRGTHVRDALGWSKYINEVMHKYHEKADVVFGTHHWPVWGKDNIETYIKSQRDTYRFIHDETMRLANHGYGPREIANMIKLPKALDQTFSSRGYYGSLKHNAEGVYNFYFGWFNGNPAVLDRHPPPKTAGSGMFRPWAAQRRC